MQNPPKYKHIIFIISFMFYGTTLLNAQFFNYVNYTVNEGFPQSNANHVMQDEDGYLWFATQNGAAKFNGFDYDILNKKTGLKSNIVENIIQDRTGAFWFSTKNGLTRYFKNTIKTYTKAEGLFSNTISRTFELPNGSIAVVSFGGTNVIEDGIVKKVSSKIRPDEFILRRNGEVCALSSQSIYLFKNNKFIELSDITKGISPPYRSFAEDENENIWLAAKNGLFYISENETIHYNEKNGLGFNKINNLLIDNQNDLWYSSEENGCGFFKNNQFHDLTEKTGFANNSVLSLFQDNENNIWIGGRNGATMINTKNPFIHFDKISPAENEIVMGITSDKENNIWFTTYGHGLTKFDGEKYTYFTKENGNVDNHFFDVEMSKDGDLYFSSKSSGVVKFDGKKFMSVKVSNDNIIVDRIFTSYKDTNDNIWFGSSREGICKYNGIELINFSKKYNFNQKNIMSICEDANNNIWFGSINNGLFKFDGEKIEKIETGYDLTYVRTIINRNGTLWIGTGSNGIFKITETPENYIFTQYTRKDGLNSDNIYVLFPDSKGNLWCGSEKGVDKLMFDNFNKLINIKNYTKDEGFVGIETNINAAFEDKEGNIWFGTVNGAVKYNEASDKLNTSENNIYLTGIRLFFEDVDWTKIGDSVDYNNIPINLVLPYNQNHLTFDFIGLCFSNPQKVQYKYRLIGQSDKWSPPTSDKKAVFSNIASGNYEFQVISANNDGVWNINPVSFKFSIRPPFWKQIWFLTLSLLFLFITVFYVINFRIKVLKNAKTKLQIKVNERTSELKEQKEQLEKINKKTEDSINYAEKIQNAMLPTLRIFEKNFKQYFIINKPKNIISGDFYWAKELIYSESPYVIIVAADCTGHGIPGALVSMLGMSILNEIIRNEDITQANHVLEELRKEIKISLKQTGNTGDQTDGIDMVVCSINKETLKMQHSGANSPMYIVRNKEIIVLNPTFNPVGVFIKEIPFKNNVFQLEKDDVLYMFSDGYVDQFNGKTGKKFKTNKFRALLLEINNQPLKRQKLILESKFSDWKGDSEQIDDVLILGIKI